MQFTFRDIEIQEKQGRCRALAAELDRRLKAVALAIDRHELAAIIEKSYSYVSEIINTNNEEGQKPFQVKYIPALIVENPQLFKTEVLDYLCALAGYRSPEPARQLTAEEELAQIKRRIKERGLDSLFVDIT